jgi:primosomal replication protein N
VSERNHVELTGNLIERDALRHTPAGIPVVNFTVKHESRQSEAGIERTVECEVPAIALGEQSLELNILPLGQKLVLEGFVARKSRRSAKLILHVNRFELS